MNIIKIKKPKILSIKDNELIISHFPGPWDENEDCFKNIDLKEKEKSYSWGCSLKNTTFNGKKALEVNLCGASIDRENLEIEQIKIHNGNIYQFSNKNNELIFVESSLDNDEDMLAEYFPGPWDYRDIYDLRIDITNGRDSDYWYGNFSVSGGYLKISAGSSGINKQLKDGYYVRKLSDDSIEPIYLDKPEKIISTIDSPKPTGKETKKKGKALNAGNEKVSEGLRYSGYHQEGNRLFIYTDFNELIPKLEKGTMCRVQFTNDYWYGTYMGIENDLKNVKPKAEWCFEFPCTDMPNTFVNNEQILKITRDSDEAVIYDKRLSDNSSHKIIEEHVTIKKETNKNNGENNPMAITKNTAQKSVTDKILNALFAKVEAFVDITTGQIALKTANGLATLTENDGEYEITENPIESLGVQIPVYATRRPTTDIAVGDLLVKNNSAGTPTVLGFVIEVSSTKLRILRPDGSEVKQNQVKSSFLGQNGFMVAKAPSLDGNNPLLMFSLLGDDDADTDTIGLMLAMSGGSGFGQGGFASMLPLLLASGDSDMKDLLPLLMMGQGNGGDLASNPMLLMALTKDSGDDMLPLLLASQNGGQANTMLPLLLAKSGDKKSLPLLMMMMNGGGFQAQTAPAPVVKEAAVKPKRRKPVVAKKAEPETQAN